MSGEAPDFEDFSLTRTNEWNQAVAESLVGKTVVIGLTIHTTDGRFVRQEQFIGTITHADRERGIAVWLRGSDPPEYKVLPPAPYCFIPADPGTYRMRSTGESIVDPDFVSTWSVNEPEGPPSRSHPRDE